ncbi:MAG: ParB N-terminal domain-containing protein [Marivibrio sp.]|uniref:ParB N-terminal domain-containing protein n=1 Tax=Marivibrio sp. TaxID=2039719 RepID=UPI0032EDCC46
MSAKLSIPQMIPLAEIEVADRVRPADMGAVEALARDIEERGLRVPIEVAGQLRGEKKYRLVSGLHRTTAHEILGVTEIAAFIVQGNQLELKRDELLENLTRSELSKLERVQFVAELKRVYLEMHPEAAHGGDRRSADFQDANDCNLKSWYASVASRSQRSVRAIQLEAQIGERLNPEVANLLRGTAIADNQKELEALSRYGGGIQRALAEKIAAGEARSVSNASRILSDAPEQPPEEKDAVAKLANAFARLSARDQTRFLEQIGAQPVDDAEEVV